MNVCWRYPLWWCIHYAVFVLLLNGLIMSLGTSLRIRPAGNMPLRVKRPNNNRPGRIGHIVIINLQKTHLDKKCTLRINFYCDEVMRLLCDELGITIHPSNSHAEQDATNSHITADSYSIAKDSIIERLLLNPGSHDSDISANSGDIAGIQPVRKSTRKSVTVENMKSSKLAGVSQGLPKILHSKRTAADDEPKYCSNKVSRMKNNIIID